MFLMPKGLLDIHSLQDTGLGVRKRIIKLLKVFYGNSASIERRADISLRLVHRMLDEDDSVKVCTHLGLSFLLTSARRI